MKDVAGFVGNMGGAGTVNDDSGELMKSLKGKIADIKSELEEMDDARWPSCYDFEPDLKLVDRPRGA